MKLNIFTKSMIGMGLVCSALPALAMEAWNNQQGGNKYQVIFDGKIYENAWWVSSTNCPGKAKANDATNPWRLKRTATAAEISQFGNTLSCERAAAHLLQIQIRQHLIRLLMAVRLHQHRALFRLILL